MKRITEAFRPGIRRVFKVDEGGKRHEPKKAKFQAERYSLLHGKRIREFKWCRSFAEAKAYAESGLTDITPRAVGITFAKLYAKYEANDLSQLAASTINTRKNHRRHLRYFDDIEVEAITPQTIDAWLRHIKMPEYLSVQHKTRMSYANELKLLKVTLRYYQSRINYRYPFPVLSQHSRMAKVREREHRPEKAISARDYGLFLSFMEKQSVSRLDRMVTLIAKIQFPLFGRIGEAAALDFNDFSLKSGFVDLNKRVVWLRAKGQESVIEKGLKAGEGKRVHSPHVCQLLSAWCMEEGIRSGPLFLHEGKPIDYRAIQYRYDSALKAAGLTFRGTHILRHGSLTEFQAIAGDLNLTKEVAGHTDIRMTQRYAKASEEKILEVSRLMEKRLEQA